MILLGQMTAHNLPYKKINLKKGIMLRALPGEKDNG